MNIHQFQDMKNNKQKISLVTCYDYWSAKIISESNIDCLLVGDSLAMVMHGYPTTLSATIELMIVHIEAVSKGAPKKFIIGDMPFCTYRKGLSENMRAVEKIMRAGANAIKLEGADQKNLDLIEHIVNSGVPVMGHLGLTPQSIHMLGGYKIQGRKKNVAEKIKMEAKALELAGCFAVVLECIPGEVAEEITNMINIPTIGIGSGSNTSGQVLVLQDMLGMNPEFKPKYLKTFLNGFDLIKNALNHFDQQVKLKEYPDMKKHCYRVVENDYNY